MGSYHYRVKKSEMKEVTFEGRVTKMAPAVPSYKSALLRDIRRVDKAADAKCENSWTAETFPELVVPVAYDGYQEGFTVYKGWSYAAATGHESYYDSGNRKVTPVGFLKKDGKHWRVVTEYIGPVRERMIRNKELVRVTQTFRERWTCENGKVDCSTISLGEVPVPVLETV